MDFQIKTYKKWLDVVWVPYQTFEVNINQDKLPMMQKDTDVYFKAKFADKLIEYLLKHPKRVK